jgi:hypothetical protein
MEIQIRCPACGAPVSVPSEESSITCPFCQNEFKVDLNETEPRLSLLPPAMLAEGVAGPLPPDGELPAFTVEPVGDFSQGTGESVPFATSFQQTEPARLLGGRLWVAIALAVSAVFCGTCLCMVVVVRVLFN